MSDYAAYYYRYLRLREAALGLANAAEALERNPMANCLPRFRDPVVYYAGRVRSLIEAQDAKEEAT